jgi:hypothetical protein
MQPNIPWDRSVEGCRRRHDVRLSTSHEPTKARKPRQVERSPHVVRRIDERLELVASRARPRGPRQRVMDDDERRGRRLASSKCG